MHTKPLLLVGPTETKHPASTQAMTIEIYLSAQDLKLTPPHDLNKAQKAAWDAAYGSKNQLFKQANLQGDELLK